MRNQFFIFFFLFGSFLLVIFGCKKIEEYPIEPKITFHSFEKIGNGTAIDNYGLLTIDFTDGDGDVGLNETDIYAPFDSASIYYYNFFIDFYEKQHGVFVKPQLYETFNARIPILNTSNDAQTLKGTIAIQVPFNNITSPFDTIRFDCQICDRALHLSNIISSPEIIVKKHE